jgi:hypothetical protein
MEDPIFVAGEIQMLKSRIARFAAIAAPSLAVVSIVGLAIGSTGAYFTDTNGGGQINATSGSVAVKVNGSETNAPVINFTNLMPGTPRTSTVSVQNTGSGSEDVYLVFDNSNGGWSAVNALGAYGIFTIDGTIYDNLNNRYAWGTDTSGQVISENPASGCYNVPRPAQIKFLPHYIKIAGGLTPTASKSFDITFQLHACMTGPNTDGVGAFDSGYGQLLYSVVAFQAGVDPKDSMNGAGKIVPLVLPYTPTVAGWTGTFQDR